MSDNDTKKSDENNGPLAGDALLQAVRQDLRELFGALDQKVSGLDARVHGLDQKVEGLDARVDARLRDTTPMWEVVVSRLDVIIAGQESHASRLDTIDARLEGIESEQRKQGARLEAIESEQRKQGARLDAIESRLDAIEIKLERFDAIDRELRHLGRRIERTIAELSGDFVKFRVDQHDLEDRVEKLEKTPA
jgi:chromosome segregation ATPase